MIFLIKVCPFFQNLGHVNCDSYQMPLESTPAYYLTKKSWFRIGKIVTNSYNIHSPTHTQKSRSLLVLSTTPNIKRPITISNKASRPAATTTNDWFPSFEEDDDRRFFLDDEVCVQLQMLLPTYLHSSSLIKDMSDWSYLLHTSALEATYVSWEAK